MSRRRSHDQHDLEPADWLKAGNGDIAIYLRLAADRKWWLAYDHESKY